MKTAIKCFVLFLVPVVAFWGTFCVSQEGEKKLDVLSFFDHEMHEDKVFKSKTVECAHCHNFKVDEKTKTVLPGEGLEESIFNKPIAEICHECHRGGKAGQVESRQKCFVCHRSSESLRSIKPKNHYNVAWNKAHSTSARIDGDSCRDCHTTAQCVRCHLVRNDIEMRVHSRNFRFTHSVEVRAQPHRCGTCHSRTFCVSCHLGKR